MSALEESPLPSPEADGAAMAAGEPAPGGAWLQRPVRVEDVAEWADTIPHEILCRIAPRVPRTVVEHRAGDEEAERC